MSCQLKMSCAYIEWNFNNSFWAPRPIKSSERYVFHWYRMQLCVLVSNSSDGRSQKHRTCQWNSIVSGNGGGSLRRKRNRRLNFVYSRSWWMRNDNRGYLKAKNPSSLDWPISVVPLYSRRPRFHIHLTLFPLTWYDWWNVKPAKRNYIVISIQIPSWACVSLSVSRMHGAHNMSHSNACSFNQLSHIIITSSIDAFFVPCPSNKLHYII